MKSFKEIFARFLEEPTREGLREIIRTNLGETNNLDFKENWPIYTKVAKHILALANSGGGCIIFGIQETENKSLVPVGISKFVDKADLKNKITKYLPDDLTWDVMDFQYSESEYPSIVGKMFQVIFVQDEPERIPFVTLKNGDGIKGASVYIRRGTSSEEANYSELQKVLNRRIETSYSSTSEIKLEEHLAHLKLLYANIDRYKYTSIFQPIDGLFLGSKELNQNYPEEDYEKFILKILDKKKKRIEKLLDN